MKKGNPNFGPNKSKTKRDKQTCARYGLKGDCLILYKSPVPDGCLIRLTYNDSSFAARTNVGNAYLSWRYRMTSVYDPDPSIGTGDLSYFNEWAAIYRIYRVMVFHYDITISNLETFPVNLGVCPSPTDLAINNPLASQFGESDRGKSFTVAGKGGLDLARIRGSIDLKDYYGSGSYLYDPNFGALTTSNPVSNLYFNIGAFAGSNFGSGVAPHAVLHFDVYFSDRYFLAA